MRYRKPFHPGRIPALIRRRLLWAATSFFFVVGCTPKENQQQTESRLAEVESQGYDGAIAQIQSGDPEGLLTLYRLASTAKSAELSEISRDKLLHALYARTDFWIRTFGQVDSGEFKHYLRAGGLAMLELPDGVASEEEFEKELLLRLRNVDRNTNGKEHDLVAFLIEAYEGHQLP